MKTIQFSSKEKKHPKGFTIIEMTLVIVIMAIMFVSTLPKFLGLKQKVSLSAEEAMVSSLRTAIQLQYLKNISSGSEPENAWPEEVPFELLEGRPQYMERTSGNIVGDGVNWQFFRHGVNAYVIFCPHYEGNPTAENVDKGRAWVYLYKDIPLWGHQLGDFWLKADEGHGGQPEQAPSFFGFPSVDFFDFLPEYQAAKFIFELINWELKFFNFGPWG